MMVGAFKMAGEPYVADIFAALAVEAVGTSSSGKMAANGHSGTSATVMQVSGSI